MRPLAPRTISIRKSYGMQWRIFCLAFHTDKYGTNINVGDLGTIQGGLGRTFYKKVSGPVPMIMNLGVDGNA
jgi:hypothetical protein